MAILQIENSRRRIILSQAETSILTHPLDDFAIGYARQHTAYVKEQVVLQLRYAEARDAVLAECCPNIRKAYEPIQAKERSAFEDRFWRAKNRKRMIRKPSGGGDQVVYGALFGVDDSPFDFEYTNKWQQGNVVGDPAAIRAPGTAIAVNHCTSFGQPGAAEASSIAGIGFWYVPTTLGTLSVWLGGLFQGSPAQMSKSGIGSSQQNGIASGSATVFFGIQEFNPAPFQAGPWLSITARPMVDFNIFGNASYSLGATGGVNDAFYLNVSAPVDDQHYYACWLWTIGYVYTSDLAAAEVESIVDSFNFPFTMK